ncbi:hypothetical protein RYQ61_00180 [Streptococcus intermedius]|uniref:DUF7720 family protein n=1 Tax=Streptococcus intermedius TaxID=1338 RepID=UPI002943A216|nr:hypothetical protein [Streptococcus intermedius]WOI91314.1 hypothetical protein RYQ61_00180 [Streptococcus intermedius]
MKILNIEVAKVERTELGFEHWVDVTYQTPILSDSYTVKFLLLMDFVVDDKEVVDYLVREFRYRDLVLHSLEIYKGAKKGHKL